MALRTSDHLRTHLSVFEAEYPIQNGYIARLLIVDGRSVRDVLHEVRSIVQAAEPEKHLHEGSFTTNVYALKRLITAKSSFLTAEWPSLIRLFIQPFPLTFMKIPVVPVSLQPEHKPCHHVELSETSICDTNGHLEVEQEKTACDKDGEVNTLADISLDSEPGNIYGNVSSNSPSYNSHTCADVEENRTVVYNSHSSVCVRENVLSDRTSNHQVITSENIKEEMYYTEDVRSGEDKNKQTQKEATESTIVIDFQAMMAGVKDGCDENRVDLHQEGNNKLLEQGLSACEKTPNCPQNDVNIVLCSRKYLNNLPVNKWKTKSVASQKSYQPSMLQSVQSPVLQSDQPSVVQSYKCKFCHHGFLLNCSLKEHEQVQRGVLPYKCSNCGLDTVLIKHTNEQTENKTSKSAQFDDELPVLHNNLSVILQTVQPSVVQPSVIQSSVVQPSVIQSSVVQPSVVQPSDVSPSVVQPSDVSPSVVQPSDVSPSVVQPSDVSPSVIQSSVVQPSVVQPSVVQPSVVQSSVLQPSVVQSLVAQSYKCKFCHHRFLLNCSLKEHEQVQRGLLPYKCSNCGLDTVLIKKVDKNTQYDDKFCIGGTFQRRILLQNYRIKHTEKQSYKCDVFGRGFAANYFLKIHKESHTGEKPYKCDVCGRGFGTNYHLKRHKIIHAGEKPYKCDICGHCFVLMRTLDIHKLTHTDEKPYHCDTCGLTFKQKIILTRHARTHDDDYPFKCDVCGHICQSKSVLLVHKKTHTGEKPCNCEICGKSYLHQSTLNVHKRIHTKERPYKCDICGAAFRQSTTLRTHKIIHTGEKPYMCDICGFRVNRKGNLRLHKKVHKA